jgi:membrane-associated phospholipid phosphatase
LTYIFKFIEKENRIYHIHLDYDISNRKYRIKPFVAGIISYGMGTIILFLLNAPILIKGLMFCYFVNALIMAFITLFWKISIHTAGIVGPLTVLIYKLGWVYLLLYLIVIPVAVARIKLKKHTILQVTVGAILMFLTTWLLILLIINPLF